MVLPGTCAILLYPDLQRADLVYPTLVFDLLPHGLIGLVMAGFFAAIMSSIASTFNSAATLLRSEEHTSELQSLMHISYAVFCLKKKKIQQITDNSTLSRK